MKKIELHWRIIIGMIVGIIAGIIAQSIGEASAWLPIVISVTKAIGDVFLRMIFMMVIPLLLCALVVGIAEVGDLKRLGRLGIRTLYYTIFVSAISVFIGISMVNLFAPGKSLHSEDRQILLDKYSEKISTITNNANIAKEKSILEIITNIIPKNPLEDMVNAFNPNYTGGGILAVMFFGVMLGIAIQKIENTHSQRLLLFFESLYHATMKIISIAMQLAPIGVACLLFQLTASLGFSIVLVLLKFVGVCFAALCLHQFGTFSLILKFICKKSPLAFFSNIKEVMLTAFSTSSSNATLPTALKTANEKLKIPSHISHFVLTVGSTANQNGTALYEGVTVLFLAQCFGVDLSALQQVYVVTMCILAGIGTAGVPGGSLPVIAIILTTVNVPASAIGVILGADRILDMCRTVLNVTGDLVAAEVVHSWDKNEAN